MFAVIAAIIFGLALLLDLIEADLGDAFTNATLVTAGLLCLALHLTGVGSSWQRGAARRYYNSRRR